MRTFVLFITIVIFTNYSYSQQNETINFKNQNVTIKTILEELESFKDINFSYNHAELPLEKTINIIKNDLSLEEILNILSENGIDFNQKGNHIILKKSKNKIINNDSSKEKINNKNSIKPDENQKHEPELSTNIIIDNPEKINGKKNSLDNPTTTIFLAKNNSGNYTNNQIDEIVDNKRFKLNSELSIGSKLTKTDFEIGFSTYSYGNIKPGFQGGLNINTNLSNNIIINSGLTYSLKGFYFSSYKSTSFYSGYVEYNINTHHIELPLFLKYRLSKGKFQISTILGSYFSYAMHGKIKMTSNFYDELITGKFKMQFSKNTQTSQFEEFNQFQAVSRVNYGLIGGISFKIKLYSLDCIIKTGRNILLEYMEHESMRSQILELNLNIPLNFIAQ